MNDGMENGIKETQEQWNGSMEGGNREQRDWKLAAERMKAGNTRGWKEEGDREGEQGEWPPLLTPSCMKCSMHAD